MSKETMKNTLQEEESLATTSLETGGLVRGGNYSAGIPL